MRYILNWTENSRRIFVHCSVLMLIITKHCLEAILIYNFSVLLCINKVSILNSFLLLNCSLIALCFLNYCVKTQEPCLIHQWAPSQHLAECLVWNGHSINIWFTTLFKDLYYTFVCLLWCCKYVIFSYSWFPGFMPVNKAKHLLLLTEEMYIIYGNTKYICMWVCLVNKKDINNVVLSSKMIIMH